MNMRKVTRWLTRMTLPNQRSVDVRRKVISLSAPPGCEYRCFVPDELRSGYNRPET